MMQQLNAAPPPFDNIIPVVLAASDNLENWPRSRVHAPSQFQRSGNRSSPFSQCLFGLSSLFNTCEIIATVPANCLTRVEDSLATSFHDEQNRPLKFIIEPTDRGTLNSVIAACLHALSNNDEAILMIVDATQIYDWEVVTRLARQLQQSSGFEERLQRTVITVGIPVADKETNSPGVVRRSGKTESSYLFQFGLHTGQHDDQLFQLGSITFASARHLLKQISKLEALCTNRCSLAMEHVRSANNALWPDINVWSALEYRSFAQVLPQLAKTALLRPAEIHQSQGNQSDGFAFQENCVDCNVSTDGHLVALAGCSGLKVVSTHDATLIVKRENEQDVQKILRSLRHAERPEIFDTPVQRLKWGIEKSITSQTNFDMLSLEVFPGEVTPKRCEKIHALMWTILSGQGDVMLAGVPIPVTPGSVVTVTPGTKYSCSNTNGRNLLIHQTRLKGGFKLETPSMTGLQKPIQQASKLRPHHNTDQPHDAHLQKTANAR